MVKHLLVIVSLSFSAGAMADAASCNAAATQKKLVGAAKTAFLKKCETDVKTMSTIATKEKKSADGSMSGMGGCGHDAASL